MRRLLLFIVLTICFTYTSDALDIKKYKIKSGIIEYKIEGSINGTETVYFDDWGVKEARLSSTKVKIMGFTTETKTLTITDKDWSYNIDLKEKTGTKSSNKQIKEMLDGMSEKDYEKFGEKMMKDMGGVRVGDETILGNNCEVWEVSKISSKTWNYEYVPLKVEFNMMGTTTYTAVKFEPNASISADKFSVPKGIEITEQEMPDIQNMDDIFKMIDEGSKKQED